MSKRSKLLHAVLLVTLAGVVACEDPGNFDDPISTGLSTTLVLNDGFVQYRLDADRLDLVRVSPAGLKSTPVYHPDEVEKIDSYFAGPFAEDPRLLFIRTLPVDPRQDVVGPGLVVVDPSSEKTVRYAVGSYFGNVMFSPDARHAILYHSVGDQSKSIGLFNPNEIALLRLDEDASENNPKIHQVNLSGAVLSSLIFVGPTDVEGASRNLVAFITDGQIVLSDIDDPGFASVTVKLKTREDPRQINVSKIIVRPARKGRSTTLFALAGGIGEVFEIPLIATTSGFTASGLNQHDGGPSPSDMAVVEDDGVELLVVVNRSHQVNIIQADTGHVDEVSLPGNTGLKDSIALFNSGNGEELVLYGQTVSSLVFCDVSRLALEPQKAFREFVLNTTTREVKPIDKRRMVMFPQADSGLVVFELPTRAITFISSSNTYDWSKALVNGNLYYLPSGSSLAWLDLTSGHPQQVVFDETIRHFMIFPRKNVGVALHPTVSGRATLFPLDNPGRATAIVSDGFILEGIMNSEVEK
jgi:hypothetical protein